MKSLFSLCVLVALISCCALTASAGQPGAQSATLDLSSFGAVGDGVTDDGPAIQRALDALADAGGGTLTVPRGRFAIITPVMKDFRGKATNVTIRGVPSSVNPDPKGPGNVLSRGLGLVSEFVVKTGPDADALSIWGLDTFLIADIVFIGTPGVAKDARIALGLYVIRDAVVRHCEFYGLITQTAGGAILHALQSGLTVEKSVFLGSTGNSGIRVPVVQNQTWKSFVMTDTIFIDYGQRPKYYGKLTVAAFSWVMLGNPAPADNLSPRREAYFRNVFFDEGGLIGVSSFPDYYNPSSKPADLIHISDFRMNVSSLNSHGIYIYRGARNVLIERGEFMLSRAAASAVNLVNAGDVILDELTCGADADTIRADSATRRLTVINSTYNHLESQAQSTKVINSDDPDKDPVQYVRQRFLSTLAREADPAANYFWADRILLCNDAEPCVTDKKNELSAYLAASPQPAFSVSGNVTKDDGAGLSGVTIKLSGSQTVSAAADANGDYTFAGLPTSGDYTLTPARVNYTFTPASQAVSRPAGDRTVDFAGKANRYRIAGRLANAAGAPVVGATVTLSGTETGTATTDANGNYSFGVVAEGTYTLTPARLNYTFTPAGRTFTNVSANQAANFTGALSSYTISGHVTKGAGGLGGVTVTLSGSMAGTKTTDAAGNYSFTAVAEGNYTVTPALANHAFTPASRTFNNLSADQAADFSGASTLPPPRVNYALAANGGVATASSYFSGAPHGTFLPRYVNDGSRRALNGALWLDNTHKTWPDWVEVAFNGARSVGEVVIVTQQDNHQNPVEPTDATTFAQYGVTSFEVQYWTGTAWAVVPGGSVTGNNKVIRKFTFAPITTSKIRVLVGAGADNAYSRIVEVEAWESAPRSNHALAANGGAASASSHLSSPELGTYPPSALTDGSRRAPSAGTLWLDNTHGSFPDWAEVAFPSAKNVDEVVVVTQQDNAATAPEPTGATTFTQYGVTAFEVQYWTGTQWQAVPGGTVTGNNKVIWRLTFAPVTTSKIRVLVNAGKDSAYSRLVEVEAWGPTSTP